MKFQVVVTHMPTGVKTCSPFHEVTSEELEDLMATVKDGLSRMNYFEVDGTLFPGDLLRSSCTIKFVTIDED